MTDDDVANYLEEHRQRLLLQGIKCGYWRTYLIGAILTIIYTLRNKRAHSRYWRVDD